MAGWDGMEGIGKWKGMEVKGLDWMHRTRQDGIDHM